MNIWFPAFAGVLITLLIAYAAPGLVKLIAVLTFVATLLLIARAYRKRRKK